MHHQRWSQEAMKLQKQGQEKTAIKAGAAKEISTNAAVVAGLSDMLGIFAFKGQPQFTMGQQSELNVRPIVVIALFFFFFAAVSKHRFFLSFKC